MADGRSPEDEVIFDVVFEDGLLFFELSNRSEGSVRRVTTQFRRPVLAPDGATDLALLQVFKKTEYLAPGKVIRVFVDSVTSYFSRKQPNFVHVALSWSRRGKNRTTKISHDLRIYRDLPYVVGRGESARRGVSITKRNDNRKG